jgi:hypothetical protein
VTLDGARSTAQNAAVRFCKAFVVYRMPGFTPGEYGVIAEDRGLPDNATIFDRFTPMQQAAELKPAGQGSLF